MGDSAHTSPACISDDGDSESSFDCGLASVNNSGDDRNVTLTNTSNSLTPQEEQHEVQEPLIQKTHVALLGDSVQPGGRQEDRDLTVCDEHNSQSGSGPRSAEVEPKRDTWDNHREFIMSMVGTCVGLGNVWRFPYLCYKNGGGAFLVPYLLAATVVGMPMLVLELSLGQYCSRGAIDAWAACPPFKGVGIGGTVMCFLVNVYYIVLICWILFYFWHSLTSALPWTSCDHAWNEASCVHRSELPTLPCTQTPEEYNTTSIRDYLACRSLLQASPVTDHASQNTSATPQLGGGSMIAAVEGRVWLNASRLYSNTSDPIDCETLSAIFGMNKSSLVDFKDVPKSWTEEGTVHCLVNDRWIAKGNLTEPVREFWERKVLNISSGLTDVGYINPDMAITLVLTWVVCYFCIWKGIKWTGKVVYFTVLAPYILLIILLVQSLSLPGCYAGLRYFIVPDIGKLADIQVWMAAVSQVCFSYAIAFGTIVTFGSYNKYKTDCVRDALVIGTINSATSLLAGVIVFSIVGFLAEALDRPVEDVALSGPGLAFLVYPAAAEMMPLPWLWSAVFFFTLFLIGLDSEFCFVESFITAVSDQHPKLLRPHKEAFCLAVCVSSCVLGLSCITEGGMYFFQLLDTYACSGVSMVFLVFWGSVALGWGYGVPRWYDAIHSMVGYRPSPWWGWCWRYFVPIITASLFCANIVFYEPLVYVDYVYNVWGNITGWLLALLSMVWVPAYFIYYVITAEKKGTFRETMKNVFRPHSTEQTAAAHTQS